MVRCARWTNFSGKPRRRSARQDNMARFRPPGSKNPKKVDTAKTARGLIPCLLILVFGLVLIFFLFYEFLNSGK
jgi:hypothetical protein